MSPIDEMGFRVLGEDLLGRDIMLNRQLGKSGKVLTEYFLRVKATNPIAYWPLWDTSGLVADDLMDLGNGAYKATGVTLGQTGIGDGRTAAAFVGAFCNIYSAALAAAFNHNECSLLLWLQTATAQWQDGTIRFAFILRSDAQNRIYISKTANNNEIDLRYIAGNVAKGMVYTTDGRTTFVPLVVTVSKSNDRVRAFFAGSQIGVNQTGLGNWAIPGALNPASCVLMASNTSSASPYTGNAAHAVIWSRELTPTEVASLASPFDDSATLRNLLTVGDSKTAGTGDTGYAPMGYQAPLCRLLQIATAQYWSENPPRIGIGGLDMSTNPTGLRYRVDADITAMTATPHEILINMGAGDVGAGFDKATWKTDYTYVVNAYHTAFPNANIRLAKIWVRDTGTQAAAIVLQNQAIDEMYASLTWLKTGINEALFLEGGDDGATYTTDGTHPNHAGYLLEADAWNTAITA